MIYLDSSATSLLLPEVKDAMIDILEKQTKGIIGNASSLYSSGVYSHNLITTARKNVAKLINASPEEIIFTSGGSEANNTIVKSFEGRIIAISAIEHPSVIRPAEKYASAVKYIPVDKTGKIILNKIPKANLISVMLANNELGTIEPIEKIDKGSAKLHTDATQAIGKIPIDVKKMNVDYLTFSAHKIGGPLGIGVLYVKKGSPIKALILGGEQESNQRAGTYNVPGIVGLGVAAEYCLKHKTWEQYQEKVKKLRNYLAKELIEKIPSAILNTDLNNSLPNLLNLSFPAAEGESIQLYLDLNGIKVSTGSACASNSLKPSHVLMAIHQDPESAHNSIRFSLNLNTTKEELDEVVDKLPPIINKLQNISTIKLERK